MGRPLRQTTPDDGGRRRCIFVTDDQTRGRLEELAAEQGITLSDVIRNAIGEHLAAVADAADVAA